MNQGCYRWEHMTHIIYKKTKKLIKTPGLFFRDYLNKRYPAFSNEQKIAHDDEATVIKYELQQCLLESRLDNHSTPIDAVFTWVDDTDKTWQSQYQQANHSLNGRVGLYADDHARFENHNELYYAIHSILKNLTWVNRIFIITDNQQPKWLDSIDNQKITIIDHRQIIDEKYLPTFNSHVIEAHLHKIPNLSENFIYFNDDVFVARPLPKTHFFAPNGNASIFLTEKSLSAMKQKGIMTPTLFACSNCQQLLKNISQTDIDIPLVHTYIPLKKSYFEKAWELYGDAITAFLPNQFRGNNDLNLATFLVPYLMYFDGKSATKTEICYYFNIRSPHAIMQYQQLLQKKSQNEAPHSFCANDFNSQDTIPNFKEHLENFLKSYFDLQR